MNTDIRTVAELFDAIAYDLDGSAREWVNEHFDVISRPGESFVTPIARGDLILRRGDGEHAHVCCVADPALRTPSELALAGATPESATPGRYVQVVERGALPHDEADQFARRLTDADGRMPKAQLVLRPKRGEHEFEGEGIDPVSLMVGMSLVGLSRREAPRAASDGKVQTDVRTEPSPGEGDPEAMPVAGESVLPDSLWADPHGRHYSRLQTEPGVEGSEFEAGEHRSLGDHVQRALNLWATAGLIEGGVLLKVPARSEKMLRPGTYPMLLPNLASPAKPYAGHTTEGYDWHYIVPDPLYSDAAAKTPWDEASLRAALDRGNAAVLSFGQVLFIAGDLIGSFDELHKRHAYGTARSLMAGVEAHDLLARQVLIKLLSTETGSIAKLSMLGDLQKAKEGKVAFELQSNVIGHVLWAFRTVEHTPFGALQIAALVLDRDDWDPVKWAQIENIVPAVRSWRRSLTTGLQKTLLETPLPIDALNALVTHGHYLWLAPRNTSHFTPWSWQACEQHFSQALSNTRSRITASTPAAIARNPIHATDVMRVAYACHFLTDAFSSGHMRVPREKLGIERGIAAKLMHDIDNELGLVVTNGFGERWRAYGDGYLGGPSQSTDTNVKFDHAVFANAARGSANTDVSIHANADRAARAVGTAILLLHYEAQSAAEAPNADMGLKHILLSARNILPGLYLGDDQVPVNRDTFGHAADWLARSASDRIQHLRKHMPKPEPVGRSPLLNHPPLFASDGTLNRVDYRKDISLGGYSVSILLKWHHDGAVRASKKFGFTDLYQLGLLYKGVNMPGVDRERGLLEVFGIIPGAELPDD